MPEPLESADGPWLAERARCDPDALALIADGEELTFRELAGRVERIARRLAALGVAPGDRVATLLDASLRTVEVIHAVERCGATLVPLNARLAAPELAALVEDAAPRLLVYEEPHRERASGIGGLAPMVEATRELDAVHDTGPLPGRVGGDSLHTILFTSGTTGRPKGAMLRRAHHHASARASRKNLGAAPHDRWLGMLPLHHVAGLSILLRSVIDGLPVILHRRFDPGRANRAIRSEGATLVSVVSTMLTRMLDENGSAPYPHTLRAVLVGGGPVPAELVDRASALGVPVLPTYGLTETASQVVTCRPGEASSSRGTCGRPLPGTEIRLGDVDASGHGEILVRGPTVMSGYFRRPEATRRVLLGGWLHTGDVGHVDSQGCLRVLDRRTDLVVTGGENVYPAEVETVLSMHPGVREAAVFGIPDREWGQRLAAAVVPVDDDVDAESLRAFCAERLARFKVPRSFTLLPSLPRTASGKVQRWRLRGESDRGLHGSPVPRSDEPVKSVARERRTAGRSRAQNVADVPTVAVVGTGYWGRNLVRNFHALGALRTLCDPDEAALREIRSTHRDVATSPSFETLLADPDLAAVALATPAAMHAGMARQALLAGKDVFVEKPLALSPAEGRDLVGLARSEGRILMVGHLLWYHPAVVRLKELVDSGELGRLQYVYSNRLNLGRFRREENILWSFAPHDISVILGLVGEEPERIQAQGGYYLHQSIADVTVTTLGFPSGVRAHVFVSWLHPYKEQRLVVVGDRKMALFDDLADDKLTIYPHSIEWQDNFPVPKRMDYETVAVEATEPLRNECLHFLECVKTRSTPRTDASEGLRVLEVLDRCQAALESEGSRTTTSATTEGSVFVHPTADVENGATVGEETRVWHHAHVMPGARIGSRCSVGQNVFIGKGVEIGNGVKIQNNVSVYEGVTLEDGVFCGPSMVFTNVFNPRSEIERKDEFRPTLVRRGATLGANSTIVCGVTIGTYAFVGAGAVVTRDVADHALVVGNPARRTGWMCVCGIRLPAKRRNPACGTCGRRYRTKEGLLERLE